MLNNYFYSWGHRHIHDFASLERLLAEAGFEQITQAGLNQSEHPTLDGIDCQTLRASRRPSSASTR